MTDLSQLEAELTARIDGAPDAAGLEAIRVEALGKSGSISELLKTLGRMSPDERREQGPLIIGLRDRIAGSIAGRKAALEAAELDTRLAAEHVDLTLPAPPARRGAVHPTMQVLDEMIAIFAEMGFGLAEGPDIEDDFHNFTALNFPPKHPAREIHDTLAQGLASIVVLAEAARAGIGTDPEASARQLASIERTARENLAEARVLVGSAPREGVAAGSIAATLRRTLDRFAEDTGLTVDADLPDVRCDQPTRVALLRCTQESLANVRKHAAASTVGVVLAAHPHGVELEITDDGRGFAPGAASGGFGLDGMRRRLAELGGLLTVTSAPGEGTRVLALLPREGTP